MQPHDAACRGSAASISVSRACVSPGFRAPHHTLPLLKGRQKIRKDIAQAGARRVYLSSGRRTRSAVASTCKASGGTPCADADARARRSVPANQIVDCASPPPTHAHARVSCCSWRSSVRASAAPIVCASYAQCAADGGRPARAGPCRASGVANAVCAQLGRAAAQGWCVCSPAVCSPATTTAGHQPAALP